MSVEVTMTKFTSLSFDGLEEGVAYGYVVESDLIQSCNTTLTEEEVYNLTAQTLLDKVLDSDNNFWDMVVEEGEVTINGEYYVVDENGSIVEEDDILNIDALVASSFNQEGKFVQ